VVVPDRDAHRRAGFVTPDGEPDAARAFLAALGLIVEIWAFG
jgi:hypothetical protein